MYLFIILIFFYDFYYYIFIPNPFNIKMGLKLLALIFCLFKAMPSFEGKVKGKGAKIFIIIGYLFFVLISSIYSFSPIYSLAQSVLLVALIFLVYCLSRSIDSEEAHNFYKYISLLFTLEILISVFGFFIFQNYFAEYESGSLRVHGIFGEPSRLAIVCAINMAIAAYVFKNIIFKVLIILLSFLGLFLTGSRTPMLGLLLVGIIYLFFIVQGKICLKAFVVVMIAFFASLSTYDSYVKYDYSRANTLSTLSGRTWLWQIAVPASISKPFGSGYCLGGTVLMESNSTSEELQAKGFEEFSYSANRSFKSSLHSGYVQALSDLGPIGFLFYLSIFMFGIQAVIKNYRNKKRHIFIVIFLLITFSNFTESLVMAPTSSITAIFWLTWFYLTHKNNNEINSII